MKESSTSGTRSKTQPTQSEISYRNLKRRLARKALSRRQKKSRPISRKAVARASSNNSRNLRKVSNDSPESLRSWSTLSERSQMLLMIFNRLLTRLVEFEKRLKQRNQFSYRSQTSEDLSRSEMADQPHGE